MDIAIVISLLALSATIVGFVLDQRARDEDRRRSDENRNVEQQERITRLEEGQKHLRDDFDGLRTELKQEFRRIILWVRRLQRTSSTS